MTLGQATFDMRLATVVVAYLAPKPVFAHWIAVPEENLYRSAFEPRRHGREPISSHVKLSGLSSFHYIPYYQKTVFIINYRERCVQHTETRSLDR